MKIMKIFKILIITLFTFIMLSIAIVKGDNPPPTPIPITGDYPQKLKESYQAVIQANQAFQYILLEARYNLNVPKDYVPNLEKMVFEPPVVKKEIKP